MQPRTNLSANGPATQGTIYHTSASRESGTLRLPVASARTAPVKDLHCFIKQPFLCKILELLNFLIIPGLNRDKRLLQEDKNANLRIKLKKPLTHKFELVIDTYFKGNCLSFLFPSDLSLVYAGIFLLFLYLALKNI
ncbi:MAG: hypothetical protein SWC96_09045 [Thermodesulfobacteriota bacterium]|nr:hypothetical protein [Thermodesulfobacteriota bacterium]